MYKLYKNNEGNLVSIFLIEKNMYIPFDPANKDYQEYLAWVAEGNEPAPPDEPESP